MDIFNTNSSKKNRPETTKNASGTKGNEFKINVLYISLKITLLFKD